MLKFNEDRNSALKDRLNFRADVVLSAPGNSDFVVVPQIAESVSYAIKPGTSSSGKIQYTLDAIAVVIAGTATWLDTPDKTVTVATENTYFGNATAFRAVCVTGTLSAAFTLGAG